ncbi:MAG TPA: amino acid racemase [Chitinophagaceae bacterium]|nr:amino acid racemase [Chitinophagaceae bacterium]
MKPIGLIGGLTYVSTIEYYRYLNELANARLGDAEAAVIIMYSVNFGAIKVLTEAEDWDKIAVMMCDVAKKIEKAGAACLLLGANTMHKVADDVQAAIKIPIIHIAEAVAKDIKRHGSGKVGLLGTRFTMQENFYRDHLINYGIETIIPDQDDVEFINFTIYNEFSKNIFSAKTKAAYLGIISKLKKKGVEGIIMGCTEIPSLINQSDCDLPLFDTVKIHSAAGVDFVLSH